MNTTKKISKFLNVPATTLRYWERIGLLDVPRSENNYREYDENTIIYIQDLNFYNNYLGVSSCNLKYLNTGDFDDIVLMLKKSESDIDYKIEQLKKQKENMNLYKGFVDYIKNTQSNTYRLGKIPFDFLVRRSTKQLIKESFYLHNQYKTFLRFDDDYKAALCDGEEPCKNPDNIYLGKNNCEMKKNYEIYEFESDSVVIECLAIEKDFPQKENNFLRIVNDISDFGFLIRNIFINPLFLLHNKFAPIACYYRCFIEVIGDGKLP